MNNYTLSYQKCLCKQGITKVRLVFALLFLFVSVGVQAALSGNYTIDPSQAASATNYQSFRAAIDDLKLGSRLSTDLGPSNGSGVSGPVVFTVAAGTYAGQLDISSITGLSATNTITFDGGAGNAATRIVTFNGATSVATAYTVRLSAQYVNIYNITIEAASTGFGWPLHIFGAAAGNNIIRHCVLTFANTTFANHVNNNFCALVVNNSTTSPTSATTAANISIDSNTINGGYANYIYGSGSNIGISFRGNRVTNTNLYGLYLYQLGEIRINNNLFDLFTGGNLSSIGIYMANGNTSTAGLYNQVNGNTIRNCGQYGIYMASYVVQVTPRSEMINNSIGGGFRNTNPAGIYIQNNSAVSSWNVFHNSVNIDNVATSANAAALFVSNCCNSHSPNNLDIRNNIFAVTNAASSAIPFYYNSTTSLQYVPVSTAALDYNIYYKERMNPATVIIAANTTTYTVANVIGGGGYNINSKLIDPGFTSATNLASTNACNNGTAIASVTTDINGVTRSGSNPDIGAFEINPVANDIAIERVINPALPFTSGTQDISVVLRNNGSNVITDANISYSVNGGTPVTYIYNGSLNPCETTVITFTGSSQYTFLPNTPYSVKIYSDNPNWQSDANVFNDTATIPLIFTGMSGNYTIDQSTPASATNFTSFTTAVEALNYGGVSGPVYFEVLGTLPYNEQVSLDAVQGTSAVNTITFDGGAGNAANRLLTFPGTQTEPYTFRINNTQYVTLKNITVRGSGASYAWPIHILGNNSSNTTVKNCIVDFVGGGGVTGANANFNGIVVNGSPSVLNTNSTAINITIDSNTVTGSYSGMYMYCTNANNYLITNNRVNGAYMYGIYYYYLSAFKCNNNVISMNPAGPINSVGIYSNFCVNTGSFAKEIMNNVVNHAGQYGIQIYYLQGSTSLRSKIVNNMVGGNFRNTDPSGIYMYQYCTFADVWFNSVNMNNAAGSAQSAALRINNNSTALDVRNNNLAVSNPYSTSFALLSDATSSFNDLNYNNYYKVNPSRLLSLAGTVYSSGNYKGAGGYNLNSVTINPSYVSLTDLRTTLICNKGVAIPGYTTDFEGDARGTVPDIGADENTLTPQANDLAVVELLNPSVPLNIGKQNLRLVIRNNGSSTISMAEISYRVNGGAPVSQTWFGNLSPCDTAVVEFNATSGLGGTDQTFTVIPGSTYSFQVYAANPNSMPDANTLNDTVWFGPLCPSLSGHFYIDSAATVAGVDTFTSFASAALALNCGGVSGPVTFHVLRGTYDEQIALNDIPGASAVNTIIFDGGDGNDSTRVLTYTAQTNVTRHTLLLNNARFVSLRNLTIRGAGSTYGWPLHIMGASNTISVKNCVIDFAGAGVNGGSTNFISVVVNNSTTSPTGTGTFANIEIENNRIAGGFSNVYVAGNGSNTNIVIKNNTFYNADNYGLYVSNVIAPKLIGNTVNMRIASQTSTGIYLVSPVTNATGYAEISRNRVYDAGQMGINVNAGSATVLRPTMLNNSVGGLFRNTGTQGIHGINITSSPNWNIIYNSVLIDTPVTGITGTTSAALYITGSTLLDCRNNNLSVNHITAGLNVLPFRSTSGVTFIPGGLNYNNYYKEGNPTTYVQINGTNYTSANFNTAAAGGLNSVTNNSGFTALSGKDLIPTVAGNNGIHLPQYTSTDINDSVRNNPPDMGAFEIPSGLSNDLGIIATLSPDTTLSSGSKQVRVVVKNFGTNAIYSFNLRHTVNGAGLQDSAITGLNLLTNDTLTVTLDPAKNAIIPGAVSTTYKVYLHQPNGSVDDNLVNDTIIVGPKVPTLNGIYTINPSGSGVMNYISFNAAVTALNTAGVSGPVTFLVAPGTYTEQVSLTAIAGVSANNTITFDGGNAQNTTLQYAGTSTTNFWTVKLNNSPYVTFRNLTIAATGTANGVAMQIAGTSDYTRVKNCIITITSNAGKISTTNNFGGILVSNATTVTSPNTGNKVSFLEIDSNTFEYGYYGVYAYAATSSPYANNNRFRANTFVNGFYYGIYLNYNEAINISGNTVSLRPHNQVSYGLFLNGCQNTGTNFHTISANNIARSNRYGIYVSSGGSTAKNQMNNNFVRGFGGTTSYGIYFTSANSYDVYHNTVFLDTLTTSAQYAALYVTNGSNFDIRNNIFVSAQAGSGIPAYIQNMPSGSFIMNYNNLYKFNGTSSSSVLYVFNTLYNATNFIGAGGLNANSVSTNPGFVSNTDLHLVNACSGKGLGLQSITTDIDGDARNVIPNMGADEGSGLLNDIGVTQVKPYLVGLQDVSVLIQNFGSNTVTSAEVTYQINGGAPKTMTWTGVLNPCDTATVSFTGANQFNFLPGTPYTIKAYTSLPNTVQDAKQQNDTLSTGPACVSLSGVYTINGSGSGTNNYTSFGAALSALYCGGVSGPVVFNIAPNTYNEQLLINNIAGASATNTITFAGAGVSNTSLSYGAPSNAMGYTIKFEGASYITFRDITIINTGASYGCPVFVTNNSNNISIRKCLLQMEPGAGPYQGSVGMLISGATSIQSPNVGGTGIYNIYLDSSMVLNGYSGVHIYSVTSTPFASNINVTNNVFDSTYYYGIYSYYAERLNFDRNIINMRVVGTNNSSGIYFNAGPNSTGIHRITNNQLYNAGQYGIYMSSVYTNIQTLRSQLINNVVGGTFRTANSGALAMQSCFYFDIFNNTFRSSFATGSEQYSTAYFTNCQQLDIRNNHFIYDAAGGAYPVNVATATQITTFNHNNFFNTGGTGLLSVEGTVYNAANFKGGGGFNQNSSNINPGFASATNLVPSNACINGVAIASVPSDILNNARNTPPDMGAYEFQGTISNDLGVTFLSSPSIPFSAGNYPITVRLNNFGANTINSATIKYSINGGAPVSYAFSGPLNACENATVTITSSPVNFALGTAYVIKVWSENPNGAADGNLSNDTITVTSCAVLPGGSYTIDPAGSGPNNFTSFNAVTSVLNCGGITGPVTFTVAPGTYTEQVLIQNVSGASSVNTITFDGVDASTRTIEHAAIPGNNTMAYTFRIQNTPYVTVKNLKIVANGTTMGNPVNILGTCDNSVIKNCLLTFGSSGQASTSSWYVGLLISGDADITNPTATGSKSNNLVIDSNRIQYGYYGIYAYGFTATSPYANGSVFRYNVVDSSYYYGIYLNYMSGMRVIGNTITMKAGNANSSGLQMMYCYLNSGTFHDVSANRIARAGRYGIYIQSISHTSSAIGRLTNNMVGGGFSSASAYGIYLASSQYWNVYHNSVNLDFPTSSVTSSALYNTGANNDFLNNHFVYSATSGAGLPFYSSQAYNSTTLNYNNYYNAASSNLLYATSPNTTYTTADFKVPGGINENSLNERPDFLNRFDLHLASGCAGKGINIPSVTTDIDGDPRKTIPNIGADEVTDLNNEVGIVEIVPFQEGLQDVKVRIRNYGSNTITSVNVGYSVNGGIARVMQWTGSLAPCETDTVSFTGVNQFNFQAGIAYTIEAYTFGPNLGTDPKTSNDTLVIGPTCISLAGTFTIDANSSASNNYPSFNDALTALACGGVRGPVVFNVAPNTYNEQLLIRNIPGASATNTITFAGAGVSTTALSSGASNPEFGYTVKFEGASYITFRDINIINTGTTYGCPVIISTNTNNITIRKCQLEMPVAAATNQGSVGMLISATNNVQSPNVNVSGVYNIYLDSSRVFNGYSGVHIYSTTSTPFASNINITNSVFDSTYYYGIYSYYAERLNFDRNIFNMRVVGTNNSSGISIPVAPNSTGIFRITNNQVYNAGQYGIYMSSVYTNTTALRSQLINNVVGGTFRTVSSSALIMQSCFYFDVFNNTFRSSFATTSEQYSTAYFTGCTQLDIRNNHFIYDAAGTAYPVNLVTTAQVTTFDYNNFFNTGGTGLLTAGGTVYNAANFKGGSGFNQNSSNINPGFVSATNLVPSNACINGVAIASVTEDILNNTRNTPPDMGAYEFQGTISNDLGVTFLSSPSIPFPAGNYPITVRLGNFGANTINSATIKYSINGGAPVSFTFNGPLNACSDTSVTITSSPVNFALGTSYVIKVWSENPNGATDGNLSNDTITVTSCPALLGGSYTIDPAGSGPNNFTSFNAVTSVLNCGGITGPVTFTIAPGTYTEQVLIQNVNGASSVNTITFDGVDASTRTIEHAAIPGNNTMAYTFRIQNTPYVTVKNLKIVANGTTMGNPVNIMGTCDNSVVKNCLLTFGSSGQASTSNWYVGLLINGDADITNPTVSGSKSNNLVIDSNIIEYGYYGIYAYGMTSSPYVNGSVFRYNTVTSSYNNGIFLNYMSGMKVLNNNVNMRSGNANSSGIQLMYCYLNSGMFHEVSVNRVVRAGRYGIYVQSVTHSSASPGRMVNNMIGGGFSSTSAYGIYLASSQYWNVYHNSVNLDFPTNGPTNSAMYNTGNNVDIRNNHFIYSATSGSGLAFYTSQSPTIGTLNYNNYYNAASANLLYTNNTGTTYTAANFKVAGGINANSYNFDPGFLPFAEMRVGGCYKGVTIPMVTTDFEGQLRGTPPDIGADEAQSDDATVIAITSPTEPVSAGNHDIVVEIKNNGNNVINSLDVSYNVNGTGAVTQNLTGMNLQPCSTLTVTFTGSQQYNFPNGRSVIVATTAMPNGIPDKIPSNDSLRKSFCGSLSGSYTIDAGGSGASNFISFTEALNTMLCAGITGPVHFDVAAGTYNEQLTIPVIPGASEVNTVTFDGGAGNAASRVLTFESTNNNARHTVKFDTAGYVSIRNLTIRTTGASYGWGVHFGNGAHHNNVVGNIIDIAGATAPNSASTNFSGVVVSGSNTSPTTEMNISDIRIDSNTIKGGYYSVVITAHSVAIDTAISVSHNKAENAYYYGIYANSVNGIRIDHNTISTRGGAVNQNQIGIYLNNSSQYDSSNLMTVNANRVFNVSYYGIYVNTSTGLWSSIGQIHNNMVGGGFTSNNATGIYIGNNSNYWQVYHNSVNLDVTTNNETNAAMFVYINTNNIWLKNNNLAVTASGSTGLPLYAYNTTSFPFNGIDYNNYYKAGLTPASTANLISVAGGLNPANYTIRGGANSFNREPGFRGNLNLHTLDGCFNGDSLGIVYDIDGDLRAAYGDIGADEVTDANDDIGVTAIIEPSIPLSAGLTDIKVIVANMGTNLVTDGMVHYSVNGGPPVSMFFNDSIFPCDTLLVTFTGANQYNFTPGTTYSIKAYTSLPNFLDDSRNSNDTFTTPTVCLGLAGNYTINPVGSGPNNFTTFQSALDALACGGVAGPVVFDVAAGTYTEQLVVGPIAGTSSTNTVTFTGGAGNAATRVLVFGNTTNTTRHTVRFSNATYVSFENMTIRNTSTQYAWPVHIHNGSRNIALRNNIIEITGVGATTSNTNFINVVMSSSFTSPSGALRVDSITIDTNIINGGYASIYAYNQQAIFQNYNNNVLNNPMYYGVYQYNSYEVKCRNNVINMSRTGDLNSVGLFLYVLGTSGGTFHEITGNRIKDMGLYGIHLSNSSGSSNGSSRIENNFIGGGFRNTNAHSGIYGEYANYWGIYFNSINLDTVCANQTGAINLTNCFGLDIRNNILAVTKASGSNAIPFYAATAGNVAQLNYNNYYKAGSLSTLVHLGAPYTLSTYIGAAGFNFNSFSIDPQFTSSTDLHVNNGCNNGVTIPGSTVDIDGHTRNTPPDVGADEVIVGFNDNVGVTSILNPGLPLTSGTQDIVVIVSNLGNNAVTNTTVSYTVNGGTPVSMVYTDTIQPCDTALVVFTGPDAYTFSPGTPYVIKAYTSYPNMVMDNNTSDDTTTLGPVCTGMAGNYTINKTGSGVNNFTSFSAAVNALLCGGVIDDVTFTVSSDTYAEQVNIPAIQGVNDTNRITFVGVSRTASVLTYNSSNTLAAHTLRISSSPYITFRNMTIRAGGSVGNPVHIIGASNAVHIKGCNIEITGGGATSTQPQFIGVLVNASSDINSLTLNNGVYVSNLEIDSNNFKSGYYGIYIYGRTSTPYSTNNAVRGNTIDSAFNTGYYVAYNSGLRFKDNKINMRISGTNNSYGIYTYFCYSNNAEYHEITGNRVINAGSYGAYIYYTYSSNVVRSRFYNNMIGGGFRTNASYGANFFQSNFWDIYHNSINLDFATNNNQYAALYFNTTTNSNIRNNTFAVTPVSATGTGLPVYLSGTYSGTMDNNIYYSNSTTHGNLLYVNTQLYDTTTGASPTSYLVAGGANSFNVAPGFMSARNLSIAQANPKGSSALGVTTDIDGQLRAMPPDIGADEYFGVLDAGVAVIDSPTTASFCGTSRNIVVRLKNYGNVNLTSAIINYMVNGAYVGSYGWSGNLAAGATSGQINIGSYAFSGGNYDISVFTSFVNASMDDTIPMNDTAHKSFSTTPTVVPTITLSASQTTLCSGVEVTFIATYSGGGPSPSLQWRRNGITLPVTGDTLKTVDLNDKDSFMVILSSSAVCANPAFVFSNTVHMNVGLTVAPVVSINASKTTICAGEMTRFTATPLNGGFTPTYSWYRNGVLVNGPDSSVFETTALQDQDSVYAVLHSSLGCASPPTDTSSAIHITVNPLLHTAATITASATSFCAGTSVTFAAATVNPGTAPVYQWKRNGMNVGLNDDTLIVNNLADNDSISLVLTSNAVCATPKDIESNKIAVDVIPLVTPSVTITPASQTICTGSNASFTAAPVNAGVNATYTWTVNSVTAGTGPAFSTSGLNNRDTVRLIVTADTLCASPQQVTSNSVIMDVKQYVTPSVSITPSSTSVCNGGTASFTATPVNGGTAPSYQWIRGGVAVGTDSSGFSGTFTALDSVTVILTSNEMCLNRQKDTAVYAVVSITPPVTPSVSITLSSDSVCANGSLTFTANPVNGGSAPAYQWRKNGVNVGSNNAVQTFSNILATDVFTVVMRSNAACAVPDSATATGVQATVLPNVTPSVSIVTSADTMCSGGSVVFTAKVVNGGTSPSFQWKRNNANLGTNDSVQTFSGFNNNDNFTIVVTSNARCVLPATATSDIKRVVVTPTVTPSVSINASKTSICLGESVTFTASATNAGTAPVYRWKVNGANAGTNSNTFTSTSISGTDSVWVELESSMPCVSAPVVNSNRIKLNANPAVVPAVTIATSTTTVCQGSSVLFVATPVNGGTMPSFQWKVNNINVGSNNDSLTLSTLANNDNVTLELTSNALCAAPQSVTSNALVMTVNTPLTPSLDITASTDSVCSGQPVTFTATPINGGSAPTYKWMVNGIDAGNSTPEYTTSTLQRNDDVSCIVTTNLTCVTSSTATIFAPSVLVKQTPAKPEVVRTGNVLSTSLAYNGYQWMRNDTSLSGATLRDFNLVLNGNYSVRIDSLGCFSTSDQFSVTDMVGLKKISSIGRIELYPNPARTSAYLDVEFSNTANTEISIVDMYGKLVRTIPVGQVNSYSGTIDMSEYADGVYFVLIKHGEDMMQKRLVKAD